jgi:hypothetical protein
MKQADLKDMSGKVSKSVCISTVVVPPVSYSSAFFSYKDSRKHRRGPLVTLSQQMREISKLNTPLINCTAQV